MVRALLIACVFLVAWQSDPPRAPTPVGLAYSTAAQGCLRQVDPSLTGDAVDEAAAPCLEALSAEQLRIEFYADPDGPATLLDPHGVGGLRVVILSGGVPGMTRVRLPSGERGFLAAKTIVSIKVE